MKSIIRNDEFKSRCSHPMYISMDNFVRVKIRQARGNFYSLRCGSACGFRTIAAKDRTSLWQSLRGS
jgi:hypothetical protein